MNDMSGIFNRRRNLAPEDLASPDLMKLLLRLGLPAMAGLSINAAHHTINMFFVGMIGGEEIAAIMIVLPILMMVAAVGEGMGVGVATEVGRALGAGDLPRANLLASITLSAGILVGIVAMMAMLLFSGFFLRLFGATENLQPLAAQYLWIIAISLPLTMAQIILDFLAIAEGNARFSMWTLVACFALNIVLDPIMIFGFGLGLSGVAIATILSQLVALGAYGFYHRRRLGTVSLRMDLHWRDVRHIRPILAMGAPTTLTSLVTVAGIAAILSAAGAHRGESGIAGLGIALRLLTVGALPVIGISLGAQSILSFAWGRHDAHRVLSASGLLTLLTSGIAFLYGLAVIIWRHEIAALFASEPDILAIASAAIVASHVPFLLFGFRQTILVLFQAQGRPGSAMAIGLAQNGYLLFPLLLVLPFYVGFEGLLGAIFISSTLTGLLSIFALLRNYRSLKALSAGKSHSFRLYPRFCP
ncbi:MULTISPECIES: MATE family efflux transporter [unclassified Sinorhizobium]|uniref:MATE family efflux transporter n=1 Tax=unclassified Sinorhizobium TaxID=2613772 RepID=UPI003525EA78